MISRNITVQSTLGERITFNSQAETFGELKDTLEAKGVYLPGMKCILQSTRTTVSDFDSSQLPEEDFVLFIMPSQTKAGLDFCMCKNCEVTNKEIDDIYNEVLEIRNTAQFIIDRIENLAYEKAKDSIDEDFNKILNEMKF